MEHWEAQMVSSEQEAQADYQKDHWDNHGKSLGYLLTAHGAALIACLTVLKDYSTTPLLKGIGTIVELAAIGLLTGALSYAALTFCRTATIKRARGTSKPHYKTHLVIFTILLFISFACFLAEVWVVADRLGSL
jgi:hypothetical protein